MARLTESHIAESTAAIRRHWSASPRVGFILGTGLSQAAERIDVECSIPFERIPHFPCTTALSHQGRVVCGAMDGVRVIAMAGRCHLYEGYSWEQVTLPVRVMRALGAELLIVSNASGGLNPSYRGGDIMIMADHLNLLLGLQGVCASDVVSNTPLADPVVRARGSSPYGWCYDAGLIEESLRIARAEAIRAHCGTYVAVPGPNYETRAEYRLFRGLGGDAVGMSTVPEVLTAASLGMRVLGLSMVTNVAIPDAPEKVEAQDVVELASRAEPHLCSIIRGIVRNRANEEAADGRSGGASSRCRVKASH
jgi:purine-nucleoside phosphorylase